MVHTRGNGSYFRDIRVVDLTRNLAGSYCTMILGDLGAGVIKIEHPEHGEDNRQWAPPAWSGESTSFLSADPSKRGLSADINPSEGVKIARRLARRADIAVENLRLGSPERWGPGYEDLRQENEGPTYCLISAYGTKGSLCNGPGCDPIPQRPTGIMGLTGKPDQPPVRLSIPVNDLEQGLWAVVVVLSAPIARQASGHRCRVETSLFETGA